MQAICGCGCGEEFELTRPHQKFVTQAHQQRFWQKERAVALRVMEALGPDGVKKVLAGSNAG